MDNSIYGIECIETDKDDLLDEIMKAIEKFSEIPDAPCRPSKLLLTSKELFLFKFESILNDIASNFKLTKREYKKYKKLTSKLMFLMLDFRKKEKTNG